MFSPERLSLARRRRSKSKRDLALALGVNENTIRRHETGETTPSDEVIERLARMLEFPSGFFFGGKIDEPQEDAASFRSLSSLSAADRSAALAAGALAFILDDWVRERFDLPDTDILDLTGEKPENAARTLRQVWGIGERPIRNMVHLLEAKGIRLFSLAENTRAVDAFSVWRRNKPYVFLNTYKTSEHSRMDAAHELGHLVLHKHGGPGGREGENEAQTFARCFLMPKADVLAITPRVMGLPDIIRHKKRWGVSVAALNYHLYKLGVTSEWQNRDLCIQIAKNGFRTREPDGTELPRELSVIWPKVLEALRAEGFTQTRIADAVFLPPNEVEKLLFLLAPMLALQGQATRAGKSTATLRVV